MKKIFGFIILLIACVAFTGCTQQVAPEPVTTSPTTLSTPVSTTEATPVPTTLQTTVPTSVSTTVVPTVKRTESPLNKMVTTVHMRNNAFVPEVLTALPGSGITWINDDSVPHSLKMNEADAGFNTGDIMPGAQWSYTFGKKEGNYSIICIDHPTMKGTIMIKTTGSVIGNPQK
jgi:plastocyanin